MEQYTNIQTDLQIIEDLFCLTEEDREWFLNKVDITNDEFEQMKIGELIPDKIQLENIYNFAYNNKLYLNEITWQYLLDEYRNDDVKVVTHGSRTSLKGDIDLKANIGANNDFSYGFYLGESVAQAGMWVADEVNSSLYLMTFDTEGLERAQFNVSTDWMLAVSYYRGKLDEYAEHPRIRSIRRRVDNCDYVYAPIADNKLFETIDAFANGEITDLQCVYAISATMLGYQYVLKSEKALENMSIKNHLYLCSVEKAMYNRESDVESNTSMNKALMAKRKYSDSGKYINEILGERIMDESLGNKND